MDGVELTRRVRSYLDFQGKDASYIDGFLEGYDRGQSAAWSSSDGFSGECSDCDLCGNDADLHYFFLSGSACPMPDRADAVALRHAQREVERKEEYRQSLEESRRKAKARAEIRANLTIPVAKDLLKNTSGVLTQAAERLDVSYAWLKKYVEENGLADYLEDCRAKGLIERKRKRRERLERERERLDKELAETDDLG